MRSKISVVTHVVEHNIKNGHLEKNELDKKVQYLGYIYNCSHINIGNCHKRGFKYFSVYS